MKNIADVNEFDYEKITRNKIESIKKQINELNDVWAVKELKEYLQVKDMSERTMLKNELEEIEKDEDLISLLIRFVSITNKRISSLEDKIKNTKLIDQFDKNWLSKPKVIEKSNEGEKTYKDSDFLKKIVGPIDLGKGSSYSVYNRPRKIIASKDPEKMEKFFEDKKELCHNCNWPNVDYSVDLPKECGNDSEKKSLKKLFKRF